MADYKILTIPFARDAVPDMVNDIPNDPSIAEPQLASFKQGFPSITTIPLVAGGIPPEGQDFNGILRDITEHVVHQNKGGMYKFAPEVVADGGYPEGAVLAANDNLSLWVSLVDSNIEDFNAGTPTQWARIAFSGLDALLNTKADKTVAIIAGTGLTGGGNLSANRTLSVSYGTTAGTAAQGNDSRITGAAQKSANLSDLDNPATARSNLGLGTAAVLNTGTAENTVCLNGQTINPKSIEIGALRGSEGPAFFDFNTKFPAGDYDARIIKDPASRHLDIINTEGNIVLNPQGAGSEARIGVNRILTTVDVVQSTGASTTKIMSQKAVTDALAFTQSLSSNGYQKLPSGLILQWGTTGPIVTDSSLTVTFPIAFPNSCFCAVAQSNLAPSGGNGAAISTRSYTTTTMLVGNDAAGSGTATWIAIGY